MKKSKYSPVIVFLFLAFLCKGQEVSITDYKRAVSFMYDNFNNKAAFNLNPGVNWFEDKSGLYYHEFSPGKKRFRTVSFEDYLVKDLFEHEKMASALSTLHEETIHPDSIGIYEIERSGDSVLKFESKGERYSIDLKTYDITTLDKKPEQKEDENEVISPDGKWIAFSKEYNLYVRSVESGEEFQLTSDGEKDYQYANWYGWFDKMEGENGDRPYSFYASWSPDSKWLRTYQWDMRKAEKMYLLDWSKDDLFKPRLLSYYRGSPGDTNMVMMRPVIFNIDNQKELDLGLPTNTHINTVSLAWSENDGKAYASYSERGYKRQFVKLLDLNKEEVKTLIDEKSETNIDNFSYWPLDSLNVVLFLSERSGWRQLYMHDLNTNETSPLTKGDYYIHSLEYIDEENNKVFFLASGKEKNSNPYHRYVYSISLKGGEEKLLTPENMNHVISFSEDGKHFVDNMSSVDTPTKTVLRASDSGKILSQLTEANVDRVVEKGWKAPETFHFTAKDGETKLYGAIWKPTNFDPSKQYPVIDHSYTGPHTQVYPRSFSRAFQNQSLAELGFVVMMVDGLGTSGRSKRFHDYSYKNMGNNLEDHVLAIRHLGNTRSWIDTSRVGIFGHSAGGYDAGHAMLAFPETYKVGVASSADHDFRMEKAWWPEMYMGWPVDDSYHEVSNITMAGNLKGKLLITHGALDDNVNPSATFKLAEALIRADKEFDLVIFPSQRHGYTGDFRKYFIKKRWNYFVEHLLGSEPIWQFDWE